MSSSNNSVILLQEILTYGYCKLSSVGLDYKKVRTKKQILFFMMGAVQSYSEAILKLASPPNSYDKAAEVLLRSLIETFINLNYIYASRSQQKAMIFMTYSAEERIDFAIKYKNLMIKHPSWNLDFGNIKNIQDWDAFIVEKQKEVKYIERYFKKKLSNKFPDLRPRAEQADSYLRKKNKLTQKNSLEKYYVLFYKYFSQISHLTMPGLERFFSYDSNGLPKLSVDSKQDDVDSVASITFIIYFVFINHFMKEFKIYDAQEFQYFKRKSNELSK